MKFSKPGDTIKFIIKRISKEIIKLKIKDSGSGMTQSV